MICSRWRCLPIVIHFLYIVCILEVHSAPSSTCAELWGWSTASRQSFWHLELKDPLIINEFICFKITRSLACYKRLLLAAAMGLWFLHYLIDIFNRYVLKYFWKWSKITYLLVSMIDLGGNFFIRENHFTSGNLDWFVENNILSLFLLHFQKYFKTYPLNISIK